MATWNEMINDVLVRMREDEVTTLDDDYAYMVSRFVQDATVQVEEAWNWSALLTEQTIATVASQYDYSLTDAGQRVIIDGVFTSTGSFLSEIPRRDMLVKVNQSTVASGTPVQYAMNGVDSNGDAVMRVYPVPSSVENLVLSYYKKTPYFTSLTDATPIPKYPIVLLALAFTARERGEVGGSTAAEYFELAKRSLSDAIAYDSGRNQDETVWYS